MQILRLEKINSYKILVLTPWGEKVFHRLMLIWEDNIKMDLREVNVCK